VSCQQLGLTYRILCGKPNKSTLPGNTITNQNEKGLRYYAHAHAHAFDSPSWKCEHSASTCRCMCLEECIRMNFMCMRVLKTGAYGARMS
jgi:hypothetical protein